MQYLLLKNYFLFIFVSPVALDEYLYAVKSKYMMHGAFLMVNVFDQRRF